MQRSKTHGNCPICGRNHDADCGWQETNYGGTKVLCHTYIDAPPHDLPNGWVYKGSTKDGMWGQYYSTKEKAMSKPVRQKGVREFLYKDGYGNNLILVRRKDDGNGNKDIKQLHWSGEKWEFGVPDIIKRRVHLYRIDEPINQKAKAEGGRILLVEGEPIVDALLSRGIAATTSIKGSGSWNGYGYPNYLDDLEGAKVVICPDQDVPGMSYAQDIADDFPDAEWLYVWKDSPLWDNLPKKGGLDLLDVIEKENPSNKQIYAMIGKREETIKIRSNETIAPSDEEDWLEQEVLQDETQKFLEISNERIGIKSLLPLLSNPVGLFAKSLNVAAEALGITISAICSSLLEKETKLMVADETDFEVPPNIWLALVAGTGGGKSTILKTAMKGLFRLQKNADIEFEKELAKREEDDPEPKPRDYYVDDFTTESLVNSLKNTNNGVLASVDELAQFLMGMNQYKKTGNDRQKWLSYYDGGSIKVTRANGTRLTVHDVQLSLVGTIQPEILRQQMKGGDQMDGLWHRFTYVPIKNARMPAPGTYPKVDLQPLLFDLYSRIEKVQAKTYRFTKEAQARWTEWHEWCEDRRFEETNETIAAMYPKAREKAARFALVLHIMNSVLAGETDPNDRISVETLDGAIELMKWTIKQGILAFAETGISEHQDSLKIVKCINRFRGKGAFCARDVRNWWSGKKPKTADCRNFMNKLVSMGYAISNGADPSSRNFKIEIKDGDNPLAPAMPQVVQAIKETRESPGDKKTTGESLISIGSVAVIEKPVTIGVEAVAVAEKTVTIDSMAVIESPITIEEKAEDKEVIMLSVGVTERTNGYRTENWSVPKENVRPPAPVQEAPAIKVGDKVKYRGRGENGLFTIKGLKKDVLTVMSINESQGTATVTNGRWLFTQTVDLKDLRVWRQND